MHSRRHGRQVRGAIEQFFGDNTPDPRFQVSREDTGGEIKRWGGKRMGKGVGSGRGEIGKRKAVNAIGVISPHVKIPDQALLLSLPVWLKITAKSVEWRM
jgi:hypothetical protein